MTEVVVVGGGPVGIMTALLLRQRGFGVRVVERQTEVYDLPRAITMDDEIQRVFQGLGLIDGLRAITSVLPGAEFVTVGGERIVGHEFPPGFRSPLGHPLGVLFYQPELERFMRAAAIDAGVDLMLGVDVTAVAQGPGSVNVQTASKDHGVLEADWLVAADGASSPIRKALGITFVDQGFDQDWLVMDLLLKRPVDTLPRLVQQICDPVRPTTFVIGHGDYRRWEFQLQSGETRDEMLDPARIWGLLEQWLTPEDAELVRAVVYRFHATVAEQMRDGRIFLAGDSAHQMPPFLGQGMGSGIRDGANLAWKLQMVDTGLASDSLLDTYNAERGPHAQALVEHAVDTGQLIDHLSGRIGTEAGIESGYGGGRPFPRLEHGLVMGPIPAGKQLPQPTVRGTPLDTALGAGFALIAHDPAAIPDAVAAQWEALGANVVVVGSGVLDTIIPASGVCFVRPDRYIAAVADADNVAAVSAELLRNGSLAS